MTVFAGKRVLLVVSGGIAAYKALDLIRRLRERAAEVRCVLTAGGAQFVTPLSLSALSGNPVHGELFSLTQESEMGHIELSRAADNRVRHVALMCLGFSGSPQAVAPLIDAEAGPDGDHFDHEYV